MGRCGRATDGRVESTLPIAAVWTHVTLDRALALSAVLSAHARGRQDRDRSGVGHGHGGGLGPRLCAVPEQAAGAAGEIGAGGGGRVTCAAGGPPGRPSPLTGSGSQGPPAPGTAATWPPFTPALRARPDADAR